MGHLLDVDDLGVEIIAVRSLAGKGRCTYAL
jgi:hypothetical protein